MFYQFLPLRYSGNPVRSSTPSNFHPRITSMGSMRLYVSHPVSLWNGTKSSPSTWPGCFSAVHGQTSPRGTPPKLSLAGQIAVSPSINADHNENMWTCRVNDWSLDSFSRKSGNYFHECAFKNRGMTQTVPIMFPGLASSPKNLGFDCNAAPRLERRETLPSDRKSVV